MTGKIILIYGLPCAGKSTACSQLLNLGFGHQLKTDEFRQAYFPDPTYTEQESNQVFEYLFAELQQSIKNNIADIIVEGVFATSGRIIRIKELANSHEYSVHCIFLYAHWPTLMIRNDHRRDTSKHLPPDRFRMFADRLDTKYFSDLTINTGIHTKTETALLINNFLSYGR